MSDSVVHHVRSVILDGVHVWVCRHCHRQWPGTESFQRIERQVCPDRLPDVGVVSAVNVETDPASNPYA